MGREFTAVVVPDYNKQPFLLSIDEVLQHLRVQKDAGLSSAQVQEYRDKYGSNKLHGGDAVRWYSLLLKQISNAMILVSVPISCRLRFGLADISGRCWSSPCLYLTE